MTATRNISRIALAITFLACTANLGAQAKLDRNVTPPAGKAPTFKVPAWTHTKLSNGADLVVTEKHDLPLVSFSINFVGGGTSYEPADKLGGHAAVGALRAVFIENVEEHELAFGIGAGFLCHGFLLVRALTS